MGQKIQREKYWGSAFIRVQSRSESQTDDYWETMALCLIKLGHIIATILGTKDKLLILTSKYTSGWYFIPNSEENATTSET